MTFIGPKGLVYLSKVDEIIKEKGFQTILGPIKIEIILCYPNYRQIFLMSNAKRFSQCACQT